MKSPKLSSSLATGVLVAALAVGMTSPARAEIRVAVNGQPVEFTSVGPQSIGGRVLIPLRAVVEALGAEVKWNAATQTVLGRKGDREFTLPIGSRTARVNGATVNLDVPAQILSGNTMVPLRFVAEALGADVNWNAPQQLVAISGEGGPGGGRERPHEDPQAGWVRGEVVSVHPGRDASITVRSRGVQETYRLTRRTTILRGREGEAGEALELDAIRPGAMVGLRVDQDHGVVERLMVFGPPHEETGRGPEPRGDHRPGNPPPPTDQSMVSGQVLSVRTRGDRTALTIQTEGGRDSYDLPRDVQVFRGVGRQRRPAEARDLQVGDRVQVTLDRQGAVQRVEIRSEAPAPPPGRGGPAPNGGRISGVVVSVRQRQNRSTITLRVNGDLTTVEVAPQADIHRSAGPGERAQPAELNDIRPGDQVRYRTDANGVLTELFDLGPAAERTPDR